MDEAGVIERMWNDVIGRERIAGRPTSPHFRKGFGSPTPPGGVVGVSREVPEAPG